MTRCSFCIKLTKITAQDLDDLYADPPPMTESKEQLTLTLDELSRFFEAAAATRFENYFVVSALCGARPQEILGHARIDRTMNT
jgi:hypothetical protein